MFTFDWAGLIISFLYFAILIASTYSIYSLHQKRKAAKRANAISWFPPHLARDIYLSLLKLDSQHQPKAAGPVPKSMIKAALLRRAIEDIKRVEDLRNRKQACAALLERRSIGDELWHQLLRAEMEMEIELKYVVEEANGIVPNWGQTIFQTANEIVANEKLRSDLKTIQANLERKM